MPKGQVPIHIMRLAPADYVNDPFVRRLYQTRDLRTASFYPVFLFWSHMEGGDLPTDPSDLASLLLMRPRDIAAALKVCLAAGKIVEDGGRLYNPRVRREVAKELEFRKTQAELGKKGAQARIDKVAQGQPKGSLRPPQNVPEGTLSPRGVSPPSPAPAPTPTPAPDASAPAVPPPPAAAPPTTGGATPRTPDPPTSTPPPRWPEWLAAYGEIYRAAYGRDSEPPWGEMNQFLGPLVAKHDHAVVLARWTRFCRAKTDAQWCRPQRFVESFGQWETEHTALATPAGVPQRKPTAAEVTAATMMRARQTREGGGGER